jgi:hypothetical protein
MIYLVAAHGSFNIKGATLGFLRCISGKTKTGERYRWDIGSFRSTLMVMPESQSLWRTVSKMLEARVGIEPTHKGFADLSLTTWVPRP